MIQPRNFETEVKLRIPSVEALEPRLRQQGFSLLHQAQPEQSTLWDHNDDLYSKGCALRIRRYAGGATLTWKGPKVEDPLLKIRPEEEVGISDPEDMENLLCALGYAPVFTMEKIRSVWTRRDLTACLDRAPFGCFLELEGEPASIRSAMVELELGEELVETRSYPSLFREAGLV